GIRAVRVAGGDRANRRALNGRPGQRNLLSGQDEVPGAKLAGTIDVDKSGPAENAGRIGRNDAVLQSFERQRSPRQAAHFPGASASEQTLQLGSEPTHGRYSQGCFSRGCWWTTKAVPKRNLFVRADWTEMKPLSSMPMQGRARGGGRREAPKDKPRLKCIW